MSDPQQTNHVFFDQWLNLFAKTVAASTFVLIFIGGLVTSTGSGLAVPDWPNTYGHFMFSFPLSKMVGGILYEHGHRMVASLVGFLTMVLTIWIWRNKTPNWLKKLGFVALLAVITQGVLGGLTVLFLLPTEISVLHGCLAQAFFMITVAIAVFTSRDWSESTRVTRSRQKSRLHTIALTTTFVIYAQLILGATMRHMGAGLAIPDFPLAFGKVIPHIGSQAVAIHFLHRVWAMVVATFIIWTSFNIFVHYRQEQKLFKSAILLIVSLAMQLTLAALTIWTKKAVLPTTAHVTTGALILGISLFITLRTLMITKPQAISAGSLLLPDATTT